MECVILVPPGRGDGPADLLDLLRRRRVGIRTCTSPYDAMAHLLRRTAEQRERSERSPLALVVIEPPAHVRAAHLLQAITRFIPHVVCWRYDADASPRLRGFSLPKNNAASPSVQIPAGDNGGDSTASRPQRSRSAATGAGAPRLRLTGVDDAPGPEWQTPDPVSEGPMSEDPISEGPAPTEPPSTDPAAHEAAGAEAGDESSASILSEEELSMLLSDDPEDFGRRRKSR